jgi:HEAT repeat protein
VPALIECLKNEDDDMADRAASALEKIGTRDARAAVKAWRRQRVK